MRPVVLPFENSNSWFDDPPDTRVAVTVLVPVFNEELAIESTIRRIQDTLDDDQFDAEIIVINDGSRDGTAAILRRLDGVQVVEHAGNRGYGASLKTGIRHARQPLIAIVDADGTYPIERLPELIERMDEADMVVGARTGKSVRYPLARCLPKWILVRFAEWLTRRHIPDLNSGMRVFRKSAAERFLRIFPDGFSFTTTITVAMLTNGYRVEFEPVDYFARLGRSKIHPIRDTWRIAQVILRTSMYFAPLRVFFPVAAVFFLGFIAALTADVFHNDLTERTLLLLVAAVQLGMFSLLADMIANRTP